MFRPIRDILLCQQVDNFISFSCKSINCSHCPYFENIKEAYEITLLSVWLRVSPSFRSCASFYRCYLMGSLPPPHFSFSMRSVSYRRKAGPYVYLELLVYLIPSSRPTSQARVFPSRYTNWHLEWASNSYMRATCPVYLILLIWSQYCLPTYLPTYLPN
jgi:hypothetical protein